MLLFLIRMYRLKRMLKRINPTRLVRLVILVALPISLVAGAQPPNINIQPQQFQGATFFTTLLGYAMYAAWIGVAGAIIYAAIEAARGNHMGDTFKRVLMGAILAAFILTFGWAILSGAL